MLNFFAGISFSLVNLKYFDPEIHILNRLPSQKTLWVFVLPSYDTESRAPPTAEWFSNWLFESANDFRVSQSMLHGMLFALFGLGDSAYGEMFNSFAKSVSTNLKTLSAKPLTEPVYGDWQEDIGKAFDIWKIKLVEMIRVWIDSVETEKPSVESGAENGQSGCGACKTCTCKGEGGYKYDRRILWKTQVKNFAREFDRNRFLVFF